MTDPIEEVLLKLFPPSLYHASARSLGHSLCHVKTKTSVTACWREQGHIGLHVSYRTIKEENDRLVVDEVWE